MPPVNGFEEIHFRFQHWHSYANFDSGQVQIQVWDAGTSTWGPWISEGTAVSGVSAVWTQKDVILTAYAGATVRVGFLHTDASSGAGAGWYIDDIVISVF
ncbi:MAG: choice-of-anchor J domain-containing protein [Rhodothermia bacterium]|nr:choice-of-anchor J domain-containing protein [Rhodothermia bacterium]